MEVSEPIKTVDEPVVAQLRAAPIAAIQPTGEQVELAQVVTPPPPAEFVARRSTTHGSILPLMALFGLLALSIVIRPRCVRKTHFIAYR